MKKLLLDTDPGVDDAMALLFLHRHPAVELLGLTTVFGNAETDITTEGEAITLDHAATGLALRRLPLALLRSRLKQRAWHSADWLVQLQSSSTAWPGCNASARYRPALRSCCRQPGRSSSSCW